MTTIEDLKKEKNLLFREKKDILDLQKRMMQGVRDEISEKLDTVHKKMNILDNQIKAMRAPDIARNLRKTKALIR